MTQSIGIIGLGAVGGAVAARLIATRLDGEQFGLAAGAEKTARQLREQGFVISSKAGELRAQLASGDQVAATLPRLSEPYRSVLLCTRAVDTERALADALPLLAEDGCVVCLQNGLPESRVAALAGKARTLGAVIGWSATKNSEGKIFVTGRGGFLLGASDPAGQLHLERVATLLGRSFPTRCTENLAGARWSKLALNCAISSLGAISGLNFGELGARSDARKLALACIAEVVHVARAQSVELVKITGLHPAWVADDGRKNLRQMFARPVRHLVFRIASRQRPKMRSGMLERLLAGRTSGQIEDLNGAVLAEAARLSIATPVNARLFELVRAIERGEAKISPENFAQF